MARFDKLTTKKFIDLHAHTYYSDGALSPSDLVQKAVSIGLAAIGIADHDSVDGLEEGLSAGKKLGIEVVPAVEITSYPDPETEFHILGYFINWKNEAFQKSLREFQAAREERAKKVVKNLNNLGYQINFGDLRVLARGTIVQPHIAWLVINDWFNKKKLLASFDHLPSTGEFIVKYLVPGAPAYEPRETILPVEAINLIHRIGGLAILAHPSWSLAKKEDTKIIFDDQALNDLIGQGLDGLEVYSHRDNEEDTKICVEHFAAVAKEKNLAASGGSDYHGFGNAGKELGFKDFYLKVPYRILEELKMKK